MLNNVSRLSEIRTPSSYPASEKRYLDGGRAGLRVPYREISLSATNHSHGPEENPPLRGSFEECLVYPGDRIDIVHPTAGG